MKFLFSLSVLLIAMTATAQKQYVKEWKRIDSLINKSGLVKTALKEVNAVYASAKKEKNDVQVIKALVFRMSLNDMLSDSGRYENIALLDKEIETAKEPAKSILNSIAGSSYWQYLQMNRWQFYNRSTTKGYDNKDISTWSIDQLNERIAAYFEKSLADPKLLQSTSLEKFDPIIIKGNARNLRPTLYDLLAFRALDYFRNDQAYVSKPAYQFEINDAEAFADAATFVRHKFVTSDTVSNHYKALKIYKEVLAFHLKDQKKDALIDADLDRLQFVQNFGVHPDKNELYKSALEKLIEANNSDAVTAPALLSLANWYAEKGRTYDANGDTTGRLYLNKARDLAQKVIAFKNATSSDSECAALIADIDRKEVSLRAEKVNLSKEPFRILVSYRNVETVYIRIIKMDDDTKLGQDSWDPKFWKRVAALPVIKTYQYNLPETNDHQQHGVEVKIESLPLGEYGIVASTSKDFSLEKSPVALHRVHVSDIAYVNSASKYYVLNRKTGAAIARAKVQVYEQYYNNADRSTKFKKLDSYLTNSSGFFELKKMSPERQNGAQYLEITYGNDRLFLNDTRTYYYDTNYPETESIQQQTFFFTDRGIYRPGQTVYFKGITVKRDLKNYSNNILVSRKSKVFLTNANGDVVDSIELTTNEFGSYSGKFTLPTGVLNGAFRIYDDGNKSDVSFNVEEYKLPKFYVEMPAPSATYRVNDTVKVTGTALSYAGNNINGASVKYRVVREWNMPYWGEYYLPRIWPPQIGRQQEIAHGMTTTDANGKYTVSFAALPDKSIAKESHPVFVYRVIADVTDLNGETISGNTTVQVAYQALKISIAGFLDQLHTDSVKNIMVFTTNMNDTFVKSEVKISIYKLNAPEKILRPRFWERPDQFIISKEEYAKAFPLDEYSDEIDQMKWSRGKLVTEATVTTTPDGRVAHNMKVTEPGYYVVEVTSKDRFGDSVSNTTNVRFFNDKIASIKPNLAFEADKTSVEPGEKVKFSLKANVENINVIQEVVRNSGTVRNYFNTGNISPSQVLDIAKDDLGTIIVNAIFVKDNRFYTSHLTLNVATKDKNLDIEYITYRDKTLPNSGEKWKVKIKGSKGEKVAAELLTLMYDASLDVLAPHRWFVPSLWDRSVDARDWTGEANFFAGQSENYFVPASDITYITKEYDRLTGLDGPQYVYGYSARERRGGIAKNGRELAMSAAPVAEEKSISQDAVAVAPPPPNPIDQYREEKQSNNPPAFVPRKNFNETAFFFPDLKTDADGNVEFSFTTPEALTQWTWKLMAHTKDLAFGQGEKTIVTQKQLMVQPNAPRFFREGDNINFTAKVANMTGKSLSGEATIQLVDPISGKEISGLISKQSAAFSAPAGQSVPVSFTIKIPSSYTKPITWRIIAKTNDKDAAYSDGEEAVIPVLSNRMLVTETIALPVRNTTSKSFKFDKLLNSGSSSTLKNNGLTVEFTSNPAWYAVQALPYLSEQKNESAEQLFNKYYANALAMKLANSFPKLKSIIEKWKTADSSAFLSNLQKNQDLKTVLLEETPWVLEAKTEAQQKKNIALLFDLTRMSGELNTALSKLDAMRVEGGFVWYKGGPIDRYMTQHIVTGLGHLQKLGAIPTQSQDKVNTIVKEAISYLDKELKKDYGSIKNKNEKVAGTMIAYEPVQYLYMRSFFPNIAIPKDVSTAFNYYKAQSKAGWVKHNSYMRALIAITLNRLGDAATAKKIVAALKESALVSEEMGMYWKDVRGGYYWYNAPIETQSVLIEAFSEVTKDEAAVNDMKTWLLKNKQTNSWSTGKATADACYALLMHGDNWIEEDAPVTIKLGNTTVSSNNKSEAGTGYFRTTIPADSVKPSMGNITVQVAGNSSKPSWGGVYWQYFEDLNKITSAATGLIIDKKLFVQKNTDRGPVIEALDKNNTLHVGDRVKVRIEIRTDRDLEYVHLKDMRASGTEPVNVLSGYKWNAGLAYYESTKDASNNYFLQFIPKGTHVFEYDLFVTHTGSFNNGVATIQCLYAPEFSSHTEGIKVNVTDK